MLHVLPAPSYSGSQVAALYTLSPEETMAPGYLPILLTFILFHVTRGEENTRRAIGSYSDQSLQKRYSEAILASDYSRNVDNMLKKNFVDWLLARREKKSENTSDVTKREAALQGPDFSRQDSNVPEETDGNRNFFTWLLKNKQRKRFP
ncbi:gastric inhibitory polypeptide [Ascaphus truei]|uniref:gastric inhibitory polypeptide n=1 Tax=Ascaphus truei TaxID=8439 RepID=UPI003F5920EE